MGCQYIDPDSGRCNFKYELKFLLFRNPITRVSQEIEICPRHFGSEIEEPLIFPVRKLRMVKDNLYSRMNREREIAKQYDSHYDYDKRKAEIDTIQEKIKRMISFKCANVLCGIALSTFSPAYSMFVISRLGKVSYKFYFCGLDCWNKMRIRTGALVPEHRKELLLTHFTEKK